MTAIIPKKRSTTCRKSLPLQLTKDKQNTFYVMKNQRNLLMKTGEQPKTDCKLLNQQIKFSTTSRSTANQWHRKHLVIMRTLVKIYVHRSKLKFDRKLSQAHPMKKLLFTIMDTCIKQSSLKNACESKILGCGTFFDPYFHSNLNAACHFHHLLPIGYTTKCRQRFQTHWFYTLNPQRTAIVRSPVNYPSGCECKYYRH